MNREGYAHAELIPHVPDGLFAVVYADLEVKVPPEEFKVTEIGPYLKFCQEIREISSTGVSACSREQIRYKRTAASR
jgi:hypothetical protein